MATHARSKKGTARFQQYIALGVDTRGAHHVVDYKTHTVHIIHPDGSRGRRLLDGGDVGDYMAAVADAHGWARREYGTTLFDLLREAVDA